MEDHGLVEKVNFTSEVNTIDPIDCNRHFITDEIIDLMFRALAAMQREGHNSEEKRAMRQQESKNLLF
jgi:hypothetical protein